MITLAKMSRRISVWVKKRGGGTTVDESKHNTSLYVFLNKDYLSALTSQQAERLIKFLATGDSNSSESINGCIKKLLWIHPDQIQKKGKALARHVLAEKLAAATEYFKMVSALRGLVEARSEENECIRPSSAAQGGRHTAPRHHQSHSRQNQAEPSVYVSPYDPGNTVNEIFGNTPRRYLSHPFLVSCLNDDRNTAWSTYSEWHGIALDNLLKNVHLYNDPQYRRALFSTVMAVMQRNHTLRYQLSQNLTTTCGYSISGGIISVLPWLKELEHRIQKFKKNSLYECSFDYQRLTKLLDSYPGPNKIDSRIRQFLIRSDVQDLSIFTSYMKAGPDASAEHGLVCSWKPEVVINLLSAVLDKKSLVDEYFRGCRENFKELNEALRMRASWSRGVSMKYKNLQDKMELKFRPNLISGLINKLFDVYPLSAQKAMLAIPKMKQIIVTHGKTDEIRFNKAGTGASSSDSPESKINLLKSFLNKLGSSTATLDSISRIIQNTEIEDQEKIDQISRVCQDVLRHTLSRFIQSDEMKTLYRLLANLGNTQTLDIRVGLDVFKEQCSGERCSLM